VREQVTIHRPVRIGQELVVSGESARRFSLRGRRYGVTISQTRDLDGRLLVSNCTTGLLRYRKEEGLADHVEGRDESPLDVPGPDDRAAPDNPARELLRHLRAGRRIEGDASLVTLEMMRVRDAGRDENPIHTDPEVARNEGLRAPIAGGSHVLAFLNEALLRAFGRESLLYGACFDVHWKGQTFAGTRVTPAARVERATADEVALALEVKGEERTALVGSLRIPLGGSGA
jgi:acyl dehydratase